MSDVDDKIENGEESENQLVDHFDELKTLGELQIQNENVEKTSENSNQKSDEKVEEEAASQKSEILTKKRSESSISSDSNSVDSSHRSSLPSLSGILSSFSGRGNLDVFNSIIYIHQLLKRPDTYFLSGSSVFFEHFVCSQNSLEKTDQSNFKLLWSVFQIASMEVCV